MEVEEETDKKKIDFKTALLGLNTLLLLILLAKETSGFFPKETPYVQRGAPIIDICSSAFAGIIDAKPDSRFFRKDIFKLIKSDPHEIFEFSGEEKVTHIGLKDEEVCRAIVEDSRGLRAFEIALEQYPDSPFGHFVRDIKEITLEEDKK